MATTELQAYKPTEIRKYSNEEKRAALDMIAGVKFNGAAVSDAEKAVLVHCALSYGLDPIMDVMVLQSQPYIRASGWLKLAGGIISRIQEEIPTIEEFKAMLAVNALGEKDTLFKVVVDFTNGVTITQFGSASDYDCGIGKGNPKTKRDMAATRALNRILRKMTRVDLPDAESLSPSDFIDISPERAALPPAQFVAETPKQRTPKAPKAEPAPEPAKPAEAEVETAKAENRARWAAESEQPAAEETVIETTVASKKSAPSPTPSVEAVADALTRLKERRDKPGFPVGAYVAAAFEDAQKFVDTAGAKGDYRAAFLIGRWHKSAEEIDGVWRSEPWQKFVGAAGSDVDALRKACVEFSPVSDDEPTPQDNF